MKLTRSEVLRKCIVVFDAIRRAASKGNAGLEPAHGMEESFQNDSEICNTLREMLREMEAAPVKRAGDNPTEGLKDWQKRILEHDKERMSLYLDESGQMHRL